MKKILFQGDSITDSQRLRQFDDHLGGGYALMVAGALGYKYPGEYEFINRGIGGNKSSDVCERMKEDIIDIKPDIMSLLVGVNDVWHNIDYNCGLPSEAFTENCSEIIEKTKAAFPDIKLMMLEPFILEEYDTCSTEEKPHKWETFKKEVTLRAEMTKDICKKYNVKFIPLQEKFENAAAASENSFWVIDGVHPTPAGHELIAREWIRAFEEFCR